MLGVNLAQSYSFWYISSSERLVNIVPIPFQHSYSSLCCQGFVSMHPVHHCSGVGTFKFSESCSPFSLEVLSEAVHVGTACVAVFYHPGHCPVWLLLFRLLRCCCTCSSSPMHYVSLRTVFSPVMLQPAPSLQETLLHQERIQMNMEFYHCNVLC